MSGDGIADCISLFRWLFLSSGFTTEALDKMKPKAYPSTVPYRVLA